MFIVTGGIHRSGTTWLYNIVKSLFPSYRYCFYENLDPCANTIYKSHSWHKEFSNGTSIHIIRDIRSVAASLFAFTPLKNYYNLNQDNIIEILDNMVHKECEQWHPNLQLKYEDGHFINTQKIANYFLLDTNVQFHIDYVNTLILPKIDRDLKTEFWPNHITGSQMSDLSKSLHDKISIHFKWWLKKNGYDY